MNVGGTSITPLYAGTASGYPGLWQVNFTLPSSMTPNCFTSAQVSAGGQLSNTVIIPIAAAGQNTCAAPGVSQTTLSTLDAGGNVNFAGLSIGKLTSYANGVPSNIDLYGGPFSRFSAAEWLLEFSGPSVGPCNVLDETYAASAKEPTQADAYLDAGASLGLSGPGIPSGGLVTPVASPTGPVYVNKPGGATALVPGGTYTFTGTGGTQVGSFTATATIPSAFTVPNFTAQTSINRSQPLTVNWTGTGFDQVIIRIQSAILTSSTTHGVNVTCAVPAAPGTYTVPAAALAYLLPTSGAGTAGQFQVTTATNTGGIVGAEAGTGLNASIPLVPSGQIDFGGFAAFLAVIQSVTIQ